jgi:hypothetical protein
MESFGEAAFLSECFGLGGELPVQEAAGQAIRTRALLAAISG